MSHSKRKTVLLTGPTSHLGIAILKRLLEDYFVIGISRNASSLSLDGNLKAYYMPIDVDLSDFNQEELIKSIKIMLFEKKSFLHGIINNGYYGYPTSPEDITEESLSKASEGLFAIHVRLILSLQELLINGASIINITSMYAKISPNKYDYTNPQDINALLYGSMKAALMQATKWLSSKFGEKQIRVNSISYGPFPSQSVQKQNPSFISRLSEKTHLKRIGEPSECSGIVYFLLSKDASYITGADISVDGGWTAW